MKSLFWSLFLITLPLQATTFLVTTNADNGINNAPISGSLRAAINAVNLGTDNDIEFTPGLGTIYLQTACLPVITQPVTINSNRVPVTIDGTAVTAANNLGNFAGFDFEPGITSNSSVSSLTIQNFNGDGTNIQITAGILFFSSAGAPNLDIANVTVNNIKSISNSSGGILAVGSYNNNFSITETNVSNTGIYGIHISVSYIGNVSLEKCYISDLVIPPNLNGYGILFQSLVNQNFTINETTISNVSIAPGGGFVGIGSFGQVGGNFSITGCSLTNFSATGSQIIGILIGGSVQGTTTITGNTLDMFSSNESPTYGIQLNGGFVTSPTVANNSITNISGGGNTSGPGYDAAGIVLTIPAEGNQSAVVLQNNMINNISGGTGTPNGTGYGVQVMGNILGSGSNGNLIGSLNLPALGNTISNVDVGVYIDNLSNNDSILTNSIFNIRPGGLGIELETGGTANNNQVAPTITTLEYCQSSNTMYASGTLAGAMAGNSYCIQFFNNGTNPTNVEGKEFIGYITFTPATSGPYTFTNVPFTKVGPVAIGNYVTATATNTTTSPGNTSEFSASVQVSGLVITPALQAVISGSTITLTAVPGIEASYVWKTPGRGTITTTVPTLTLTGVTYTDSGMYTVTAAGFSCPGVAYVTVNPIGFGQGNACNQACICR